MAFPDVEGLAGLRVTVILPIAAHGPLALPREVRIGRLTVVVRGLGRKRPPAAPPHIPGHLMQPHADVGRDARIAVEGAVVIVPAFVLAGWKAHEVDAVHLPRWLVVVR